MAQIEWRTIKKVDKDKCAVHEKVQATYSVFEKTGQKYFQIDTYGKSDREIPGKISQSFQLDKESAKFLVEKLKKEFDL